MSKQIQAYDIYNSAAYGEIGNVKGATTLSSESMAKIANLLVKYGFLQYAGQSERDYGMSTPDPVNHPSHYTAHPSGVECVQITEHMNFCLGNAMKYLWRAGLKGDAVEDLKKANWYIEREISRLEKQS